MNKKRVGILLAGAMLTGTIAGAGSVNVWADDKPQLTVMISNSNDPWNEAVTQMVVDHFPEYDITIKNWNESTVEQTVKTAYAADQAVDVVGYWPTYMKKFEGTGIPLDLTSYMDADEEWKNGFPEGALATGTTDEGLLCIPNTTNYPIFQVNKNIFDEAGIEIPDVLTWDEFMDICEKIKAAGKTPVTVQSEWAGWFVRNALLQCWDDKEELDAFIAGDVSFKNEKVVKAMDNIAEMYTSDYVYPGGIEAVTTSADDAKSAFINGEAAIFCNVVSNASSVAEQVGDKFELAVVSWPSMASSEDMYNLLGSSFGYMAMSNTKYPDEAVEVIKYLTSTEVLQAVADAGGIVTNVNVTSSDENYSLYSRYAGNVYPDEVINLSSEIFDNLVYSEPSNYLFNGEAALDELEVLREAAK